MLCPDSMVSRGLSGRPSPIRHRSILMGAESCRSGLGEGYVRGRLFSRGWNWDNTEHARVGVLKFVCLCLVLINSYLSGLSRITNAQQN